MRTLAPLAAVLCLALLPAQEPPAGQQRPADPERPRPVLVDTVVATVNDAAIMLSTIRSLTAGRINAAEQSLGRPLRSAEIISLFSQALELEVERHAMAQSAKSFGIATPEQVEQLFEDEMKREEQEQVRDFGTWQEFSRELQRQGRTWETYWREQRVEKMYRFAQELAVGARLQKQENLFLTPKMLRETYRREIDRFVHGARAELSVAIFTGPDADANAARAATIWAVRELTATELIAAVPGAAGSPHYLRGVTEASRDDLAAEVVDFALAGPVGRVSPPTPVPGGCRVVRIAAYQPARDGRFEDPAVQLELREICLELVIGEFQRQALDRAADRTEVWKARIFR